METLQLEAEAFLAGDKFVNPFLSGDDYATVRQEVGKLAAGIVEGKVTEFLAARSQFAKDTGSDQIDHFAQRPEPTFPQPLQSYRVDEVGASYKMMKRKAQHKEEPEARENSQRLATFCSSGGQSEETA